MDKILKNKNPDRLHEKIVLINSIFELIVETICNYQDSGSRAANNSRKMNILNITS
jgi:hypothetical protein